MQQKSSQNRIVSLLLAVLIITQIFTFSPYVARGSEPTDTEKEMSDFGDLGYSPREEYIKIRRFALNDQEGILTMQPDTQFLDLELEFDVVSPSYYLPNSWLVLELPDNGYWDLEELIIASESQSALAEILDFDNMLLETSDGISTLRIPLLPTLKSGGNLLITIPLLEDLQSLPEDTDLGSFLAYFEDTDGRWTTSSCSVVLRASFARRDPVSSNITDAPLLVTTYATGGNTLFVNPLSSDAASQSVMMFREGMRNLTAAPIPNTQFVLSIDDLNGACIAGFNAEIPSKFRVQLYTNDILRAQNTLDGRAGSEYQLGSPITGITRVVFTPLAEDGYAELLVPGASPAFGVWITGDGRAVQDPPEQISVRGKFSWKEGIATLSKTEFGSIVYLSKVLDLEAATPPAAGVPGDLLTLNIHVNADLQNAATINTTWTQPVFYVVLPPELMWVPGQTIYLHDGMGALLDSITDTNITLLPETYLGRPIYKVETTHALDLPVSTAAAGLNLSMSFRVAPGLPVGMRNIDDFLIVADAVGYENAYHYPGVDITNTIDNSTLQLDGLTQDYLKMTGGFPLTILSQASTNISVEKQVGGVWSIWSPWEDAPLPAGGTMPFRVIVKNTGNVALDELYIYDLLPNKEVNTDLANANSNSNWTASFGSLQMSLRDAGGAPRPVSSKLKYATTFDPTIADYHGIPGRSGVPTTWNNNAESNAAAVKTLQFDLHAELLQPDESIVIEGTFQSPYAVTPALISKTAQNSLVVRGRYLGGGSFSIPMAHRLVLNDAANSMISGTVYQARNATTILATPLQNAQVTLYRNDRVTVLAGPITTDINGFYLFGGLSTGDYYLKVEAPAGSSNVLLMNHGSSNHFGRDGFSDLLSLPSNGAINGQNAGFYRYGSINAEYRLASGDLILQKNVISGLDLGTIVNPSLVAALMGVAHAPVGYTINDMSIRNTLTWENPVAVVDYVVARRGYPVQFVDNREGSVQILAQVTASHGETISAPTSPTAEGWTFVGWATMPNAAASDFDSNRIITADTTFYGIWQRNLYNVQFLHNHEGSLSVVDSQLVEYGKLAALPTPPTTTGWTFMGWATKPNTSTPNYQPELPVTGNLTLYGIWQINTYTITVEHWKYDRGQVTNQAVLANTEQHSVLFGKSFAAKQKEYGMTYSFQPGVSDRKMISSVSGDQTIRLYYRQDAYALGVLPEIELQVNDKYPNQSNRVSWKEFLKLVDARTVGEASGKDYPSIKFEEITSPDFADLDYSKTNNGFDQIVTIDVTWEDGHVDSKTVRVKITDLKPPVITVPESRRFEFTGGNAPASEVELIAWMKTRGLVITDNYAKAVPELTYLDGGFDSIDWQTPREYAILINAKDTAGNQTPHQKAVILVIH